MYTQVCNPNTSYLASRLIFSNFVQISSSLKGTNSTDRETPNAVGIKDRTCLALKRIASSLTRPSVRASLFAPLHALPSGSFRSSARNCLPHATPSVRNLPARHCSFTTRSYLAPFLTEVIKQTRHADVLQK